MTDERPTMRLRSVRMKSGGAKVRVLHTPVNDDGENLRGLIQAHAREIGGYDEPNSRLDGFIIIGLFDDNTKSVSFRIPKRIPSDMLPAYVSEIMRREAIVCQEAADEFDRRFEWQE